jgi:hypothetical protein
MTWTQAKLLIESKLTENISFDPTSESRSIIESPSSYSCRTYNYYPEKGFKVKIGYYSYIDIPWSMLENMFEDSKKEKNRNIYRHSVFVNRYPNQAKNHGCHIHVVGKMFVYAGVARQVSARNYMILD